MATLPVVISSTLNRRTYGVPNMLHALAFAAIIGLAVAAPADYVSTFIGTGGVGFGIGSTNPGAQVPFGALRLGPDTSLGLGAIARHVTRCRGPRGFSLTFS